MEVVCEHCGTEYEFDDALVSERGTAVKCTGCGHQFKVFKPSEEGETPKVWNLRRPDGTVIPFDSLAVLQKWILEGKVSKMDEISRAGEGWKALGAIAELESFFVTAESRASLSVGPRSARPTGSHSAPAGPSVASVSVRSGSSRHGVPNLNGSSILNGNTIRPVVGAAPPPPAVLRGPSSGGTPPPLPPAALRGSSRPHSLGPSNNTGVEIPKAPKLPDDIAPTTGTTPRAQSTSDRPPPLRSNPPPAAPKVELPPLPPLSERPLADDNAPTRALSPDRLAIASVAPPAARRSSLLPGLLLGVALAGVGILIARQLGVFGPSTTSTTTATSEPQSTTPTGNSALIDQASTAARPFTPRALEESRDLLTRALGASPNDAEALANRADVSASWSELLHDRANDLELQARADPSHAAALNAEAAMLRSDAEHHADRARTDLTAAEARLDTLTSSRRTEAEARLADAARIVGAADAAQRHLEALRQSSERSPTADLVLALATPQNDPTALVTALRQALNRDNTSVRARLALARALARAGDTSSARTETETILRQNPNNSAAAALLAVMPPSTTTDAGTTVAESPTPPTELPSVRAETPRREANASSTAAPTSNDYDHLVAEGDRLQHSGRTTLAREHYNRALTVRPNGAEALTGMGNVEIDRGNASAAVSRFRAALSANPRYSDAYLGLGEAYGNLRNYRQAIESFERYLQVNPSGSRAYMARSQISALQARLQQQQGETPGPSNTPQEPQGNTGPETSGP